MFKKYLKASLVKFLQKRSWS